VNILWRQRLRYDQTLTCRRTIYESECGRFRVERIRSKFGLPPRVLAIADGIVIGRNHRTIDAAKRRLTAQRCHRPSNHERS